jgi:3-oxoacyl-[acyl-carrier-protein] synthase-3
LSSGIVAIEAYVPSTRVDLRAVGPSLGADSAFLENKTGALLLPRKKSSETASDLAERAVRKLFARFPGLESRVQLLVVVTQNPDGFGLPHASAILHGKLGLPSNVAAFDVSLGCSGWVYGIALVKAFLDAHGLSNAILVTADPYSNVVDPSDKNTMLLFGDAATATLVSAERPRWSLGKCVFGTDGTRASELYVDRDRKLRMNGRAIFTFSATQVPAVIDEVLTANGLSSDAVDRILLHQGSRYIVETIGQRMKMETKTPFVASATGNTVSSSIPLALIDERFDSDRRVVVCGFGVGLSWAATVLTRCVND